MTAVIGIIMNTIQARCHKSAQYPTNINIVLAIKGEIPIIPISISGSRFILRKHSNKISPGKIKIVIGDPINTKDFGYQERENLGHYVRDIIVKNYDEHFNEGSI